MKKSSYIYTAVIATVFIECAIALTALPRSTESELEKRSLAKFPTLTADSLFNGSYTAAVSSWFSDTVPFRDEIMEQSMTLKNAMGIKSSLGKKSSVEGDQDIDYVEEDNVSFVATDNTIKMVDDDPDKILTPEEMMQDTTAHEDEVDAKVRFATSGIIITGQDSTTRAMSTFHGSAGSGATYVGVVNKYKEMLGSKVNVWCMPIPTAIEYYCPSSVASRNKSQRAMIETMMTTLSGAKGVNICDVMAAHKREDIYLRTDHHWAPLGGFYAAQAFAKAAGVPFRGLDAYEKKVVPGYVGSMFGYSKDINVKKNPETFVYYVPTGVSYTTTFVTYFIDEEMHVTGESKPFQGSFFKNYKGNNAYLNFMGTDCTLVKVQTSTHNGRRLLILKDSFGNTLPGYMFYSFEEVHVVDYRYFTKNILKYIDENGITDVLFANNTFAVCTSYTSRSYSRFLTKAGGYTPKPEEEKKENADSVDKAKAVADTSKVKAQEPAAPKEEEVPEPVKEEPAQPIEKPDTLA